LRFNFFKAGKFAIFIERPKVKCVSASGGKPPDPLTRGFAPGPRWGLRLQTPYYRGLTLVFGGLQLSNAGTKYELSKHVSLL